MSYISWNRNTCPHLWETKEKADGSTKTFCIVCGLRKLLVEPDVSGRKLVRDASTRPTRKSFSVTLSLAAIEKLDGLAKRTERRRSEVLEALLLSLSDKKQSMPEQGQEFASTVYVIEKLNFDEWDPYDCAVSREEALIALEQATEEVDGRVRFSEYVLKKPFARLVNAVTNAFVKHKDSAKDIAEVKGALGHAAGLLKKRA